MAKNRQKSAKFIRKIDFLYNNFPKKAISLRKCTKKKNRLRRKKKSKKKLAPAALYRWTPPTRGGWGCAIEFFPSGHTAILPLYLSLGGLTRPLRFETLLHFFGKKSKKKIGPKKVWKWPKSGQKWPKLPQNRRNNWRGSPRKSQRIPKISAKWPKTFPQCKMKMHQKSKKWPKVGKNR